MPWFTREELAPGDCVYVVGGNWAGALQGVHLQEGGRGRLKEGEGEREG